MTTSEFSIRNRDEFRVYFSIHDAEPAHADRQLEPSRARAPRIEIEHSVARLLLGNVAMAVDQYLEARRLCLQVKLRQVVQDIDRHSSDLNNLSLGQPERPFPFVDIAADRSDRRDLCKRPLCDFNCEQNIGQCLRQLLYKR